MHATHQSLVIAAMMMSAGSFLACSEGTGNVSSKQKEGDDPNECTDNADNDGNGAFDCDDPQCAGAPLCKEKAAAKKAEAVKAEPVKVEAVKVDAVKGGAVIQATTSAPATGTPVGGTEQGHGEGNASSELAEGSLVHRAGRVADDQLQTAWCEASSDDGVGQWVELRSPCFNEQVEWIGLVPGYASKPETFAKNNRVKVGRVSVGVTQGGTPVGAPDWAGTVAFADVARMQYVNIPALSCQRPEEIVVRMEIVEVYPGSKYRDTCVSEMSVFEK